MFIRTRLVDVRDGPHLFAHDSGGVVHGRGSGKALALVKSRRNSVRMTEDRRGSCWSGG